MAQIAVGISAAVGTRHGITPLPNLPGDLDIIKDLFDRIPMASGGTFEIANVPWQSDRTLLIAEITGQIAVFQGTNPPATVDMAIDPRGGTLRRMNELANDPPVVAHVAPPPGNYQQDFVVDVPLYAAEHSLAGQLPLIPMGQRVEYSRRLVSFNGSSIKWFGVLVPSNVSDPANAIPHLFYTPTPIQGGYRDESYQSFGGWGQLWDDYTSRIGGLISASGANQILVLPFYMTGQGYALGSFLQNWQETISAVVTAALNDMNPYYLDNSTYSFSQIVSASFSNGVNAHRNFHTNGAGATDMTQVLFDLDGVAQTGGSNWRPSKGVIYQNRGSPTGQNPMGNNWFVGGRWGAFDAVKPETSRFSHHACSEHLLFHGLSRYCGRSNQA